MRLQKLVLILALLMTGLLCYQMARTLAGAVIQLRDGTDGIEAMTDLQRVLVAAEMASRERGPANGILGDQLPHDPAKLALLAAARQKTDTALNALITNSHPGTARPSSLSSILLKVRHDLQLARQALDATAAEPIEARTPAQIRAAIGGMFHVIDDLSPASLRLTNVAQATYPNETNLLYAAGSAGDLREFAGRLGSQFTVALTMHAPIEMSELTAIEQLLGRIEQLHSSLLMSISAGESDSTVERASATMQSRYFNTAMPYIGEQLAIGLNGANFATDAAGFATRYVPEMDSIIDLRDILINAALRNARQEQANAQSTAYFAIASAVASLLLLAAILLLLEFRIGRPLRTAIDLILDVAHGRLNVSVPTPKYQDEMAEVLQAITVFRDNSLARLALESERQQLLVKLKEQAATDFLTELPNRRGFFDRIEPVFQSLRRHDHPISLAIYDIDHFKQVNDIHGHDIGDAVLKAIASLSQTHLRSGDVVARFGGEEFLLFMPYCSLEAAVSKVEQLRALIADWSLALPDGSTLRVTASFGVASCLDSDTTIDAAIKRCDEKLYLAKGSGRNKVLF